MKYLYISKIPYLSSLNRNIGCIETFCLGFYTNILLLEPKHRMYWNLLKLSLYACAYFLNRNIGCIETYNHIAGGQKVNILNRNIGCIETFKISFFCDIIWLEPKHRMYWNFIPPSILCRCNSLEPKHRMYWNPF